MRLEKLYKKLRLWYFILWMAVAVVVGIGAGTIWEDVAEWKLITALAVPIVLSALAINAYWNRQFIESVQLLFPVLERDPDQFIADFEELTSGKHVRRNIALTYYNNMGTAYARKKCYREALSYYEKVNPRMVRGSLGNAVYWGNVALMHFMLDETEEALAICEKKQSAFRKFPLGTDCPKAPDLPFLTAHLEVRRQLALGHIEEAKLLLKDLREHAVKPIALEVCDELEALLSSHL